GGSGSFVITGSEGFAQQPGTHQAVFPTSRAGVSAIDSAIEGSAIEAETTTTMVEPEAVYQLADGRLIIGRACQE
ncbi:MAG: hypothetical protein AAF311_08420, partial [Pseudomonadota bacterium]